jgi:PIN domain nuclease of toxin-antitoxin system
MKSANANEMQMKDNIGRVSYSTPSEKLIPNLLQAGHIQMEPGQLLLFINNRKNIA